MTTEEAERAWPAKRAAPRKASEVAAEAQAYWVAFMAAHDAAYAGREMLPAAEVAEAYKAASNAAVAFMAAADRAQKAAVAERSG